MHRMICQKQIRKFLKGLCRNLRCLILYSKHQLVSHYSTFAQNSKYSESSTFLLLLPAGSVVCNIRPHGSSRLLLLEFFLQIIILDYYFFILDYNKFRLQQKLFSVNFSKFLRTLLFTEHLRLLLFILKIPAFDNACFQKLDSEQRSGY